MTAPKPPASTPEPWLDDGDVRLYHGDALEQLALMPSESVQCIVTSPPFWGLRDYGTGSWTGGDADCDHPGEPFRIKASINQNCGTGNDVKNAADRQPFKSECGKCGARRIDQQIGLEETPDEWCAKLVAIMREARRVLRRDGVCWIEVGDTYANFNHASRSTQDSSRVRGNAADKLGLKRHTGAIPVDCKPKDLVGAPWLLAFALRADGWYLRSDTIWARPNPMPESVTDRPTKAHSYVFLLTKSARYFYDADAIREPHSPDGRKVTAHPGPGEFSEQARSNGDRWPGSGRNARSVWSIATESTPFAHFATFPQALVERCIKAGTSEHGACSECGAPWRRITELGKVTATGGSATGARASNMDCVSQLGQDPANGAYNTGAFVAREHVTVGWEPSCAHDAPVVPCLVADPFMGSGTTALVARRLARRAIGIELNAEYLKIAAQRLQQPTLWSQPV